MASKKDLNAAARRAWTDELIAQRAVEFFDLKSASRCARYEYSDACERFKTRRGIDYLDTKDPKFRRSTRKAYEEFLTSRVALRNAQRRLETAVRNRATSAPIEVAKAPMVLPPEAGLAVNLALVESYCRLLDIPPSERLELLRRVATRHGIDVSELPDITTNEVPF